MSLSGWCQSALLIATAASAAIWVLVGLVYQGGDRRISGLASTPPRPGADLPSLTIISAARNEERRVGEAVRTLLAQDYPRLQIVAVDDRSEDRTGAILDEIAASNPRLEVVHLTSLPEGWLGKCHALAVAAAAARGEWILFTDGDVSLAPDAARRAVSLALRHGADHVAVSADFELHGLWEEVFVAFFVSIFNVSQRPWDVPDPRSSAHIGIGAFNLVRASAYARAGGHERLRMELLDDMGLGLTLKQSGARSMLAGHDGLVRARWQEGIGGLIAGVEKNAFPALGYRVGATIASVAIQIVLCLTPVAGLFASNPWTRAAALVAWSGVFLVYSVTARSTRTHVWHALTMPIGGVLFAYSIAFSMVMTLARGGVVWRGTFYPMARLRAGRVRAMDWPWR